MLDAINARLLSSEIEGAPALSTLHQAKGLEANWVELLDDFAFAPTTPAATSDAPMSTEHIEECNVLYVALTRAKAGLAIRAPAVARWAQNVVDMANRLPEREQDLFGA